MKNTGQFLSSHKLGHITAVAEYMFSRAGDYGVDPDIAYTVGLLHDIGYLHGREGHEARGAELLCACGMNDEITYAIGHHASLLEALPPENISRLLVLLAEADLSVDHKGACVGFDERLKDIKARYADTIGSVNGIPVAESAERNMQYITVYCEANDISLPTA